MVVVIRSYRPHDSGELAALFYHTIHTINARDYTEEQLDAWAPKKMDREQWERSFHGHACLVAVDGPTLVGFGDMDKTGYLDRLFVHAERQRQGIAAALLGKLEQTAGGRIVTCASITARPFFEKRGYSLVKEQQVERRGILLTNFVMEKSL